jgi:hypothetical protein
MSKKSIWDHHREAASTVTEEMQVIGKHPENNSLRIECGCGHKFWFDADDPHRRVIGDRVYVECPSCNSTWNGETTAHYGLFSMGVDFSEGACVNRMVGPLCVTLAKNYEEASQLLTNMMVERHGNSEFPLGIGRGFMVVQIPPSVFDTERHGREMMEKFGGVLDIFIRRGEFDPTKTNTVDEAVARATGQ